MKRHGGEFRAFSEKCMPPRKDHGSPACSGAGRPGGAGLAGRLTCCWVGADGTAGLRAVDGGVLALVSAGAVADCAGPVGSALMMLTGGIEADDGSRGRRLPAAAGGRARGRYRRWRGDAVGTGDGAAEALAPSTSADCSTRWRGASHRYHRCAASDSAHLAGITQQSEAAASIGRAAVAIRRTCATMPNRSVSTAWRSPERRFIVGTAAALIGAAVGEQRELRGHISDRRRGRLGAKQRLLAGSSTSSPAPASRQASAEPGMTARVVNSSKRASSARRWAAKLPADAAFKTIHATAAPPSSNPTRRDAAIMPARPARRRIKTQDTAKTVATTAADHGGSTKAPLTGSKPEVHGSAKPDMCPIPVTTRTEFGRRIASLLGRLTPIARAPLRINSGRAGFPWPRARRPRSRS